MSARVVRAAATAAVLFATSSVWGQYEQPRRPSQAQPPRSAQPRNGAKEFRFSEENDLPAATPADRGAPTDRGAARRAGEIRPVAGQTPIRQPGSTPEREAAAPQREIRNALNEGTPPNPANRVLPGAADQKTIPCPWDPLNAKQQQGLDSLMKAWEEHSSQIERYRCNFTRWEFDPIFGPKDPSKCKTVGEGRLLYAAPDKGLFEVISLKVWSPPAKEGDKEEWKARPQNQIGEYWICDGKRVFELDARQKKLFERELPPDMQGNAIVDGPLPFLFGAKADKISARYWLRIITPDDVTGEQWIEASPKNASDARNFKMVHVIIDEKDFLPKAIQVFDPAFHPQKRPIRSVYTFEKREYNWAVTPQFLRFWQSEFYEPKTPFGWTKVVEPFFPEPGQEKPAEKPPMANKPNPLKLPFRIR
jgi:TIGR03009 family protein